MSKKDEKPFDFWNDHSLEFLEMAMKRDYQEKIVSCHGHGSKTRSCGDTIDIFLMIQKGRIETISYDLKGCLFSHACVNTLINLVKGKRLESARQVKPQDIIHYLKTLPEQEEHCADHVLDAFHLALKEYEKNYESASR